MDDLQIQNLALQRSLNVVGLGQGQAKKSKPNKTPTPDDASSTKDGLSVKEAKNNDWIPTQAVRTILEIRDKFEGVMNERCISRILYDLNNIWREIMRKENSAIKKRLTSQIMDLKRQIVTKQAFDKGELIDEIQRLKKELAFANK